MNIGIKNIGIYVPEKIKDSKKIADLSGIPEYVIREKFGIKKVHQANESETVSEMGKFAAKKALKGFNPKDLDLIISQIPEWFSALQITRDAICESDVVDGTLSRTIKFKRSKLNDLEQENVISKKYQNQKQRAFSKKTTFKDIRLQLFILEHSMKLN